MRRKSTTLISMVLAIALTLTACNGDDDPDNGGTTDPGTGTTLVDPTTATTMVDPTTTTVP
ncbi:MAG TPA: hypothetical protein VFS66_00135 [Acidimicrobiia bacterium]|nr:hypothetical protein [Acidimicrobiia bacterium]